jgi:hypothetical protein
MAIMARIDCTDRNGRRMESHLVEAKTKQEFMQQQQIMYDYYNDRYNKNCYIFTNYLKYDN